MPDERNQERCAVETTGLPLGRPHRVRALGGTTTVWSGKLGRLDPIDLEQRAWVAQSGWPLGYDELQRAYDRAAALLDWPGSAAYSPEGLRSTGGLVFDGPHLQTAVFHRTRRPTNFATLWRRRSEQASAGVSTYLHATVTDIVLAPGHGAVERVTVTASVGQSWAVLPRILVLACGAIENARLLLASNGQSPAGVGNARDQVGRYFMDHPKATAGTIALTPPGTRPPGSHLPDRAYWARKKLYGTTARWGLRLSAATQADRGVLNSHVFLDPVHATEAEPAVDALKSLYTGKRKAAVLPALRQVADDVPAAAQFLRYKVMGRGPIAALELTTFLEQPPLAHNRVVLSSEHDDLGCRRARVDWSISDLERHSVRTLHKVIADDVRRRGLGTLHSPFLSSEPASWPRFRDASHHAGTTRMGHDPATSVVDPHGQVHGVENLFVAGSSVFPTVGYANPTFTIVALALRLADELARRLSHPTPISGPA